MRDVEHGERSSGYWYGDDDDARRRRAVALLQSFRLYRSAESAMRRRTRREMGMGENDLLALRYLLKAAREDRLVSPHELSRYLGVSTASMTALVDRLVRSGHVRREPHPRDRRSVIVVPTPETDEDVRRTLGGMHARMLDAVIDMSPEESRIVAECLERLQAAVDSVHPVEGGAEDAPGDAPPAQTTS